jgi:TRAP-type C4-dicarboxylate transport system substrate-binding protein
LLNVFARDVERRSEGRVRLKWYFGALAGDEREMAERVRRGQLQGVASGTALCEQVMPSMAALAIPALFQNWDEADYVVNSLSGRLTDQAKANGYVSLTMSHVGASRYFLREPISTLAELRKRKLWVWGSHRTEVAAARGLGLLVVPDEIDRAGALFDNGKIDGLVAVPAAALAYQWSVQATYLVDLRESFLYGCLLISSPSFLSLSLDDQRTMLAAGAELRQRLSVLTQEMEDGLLGGLFQHQGVKMVPVSESFRAEYFAAARAVRDKASETWPPELVREVQAKLADYRAEHAGGMKR